MEHGQELRSTEDQQDHAVLCVDLDGTLVATDTLDESLLSLVKLRPLMLFQMPYWLLRGKAYFKERVATVGAVALGDLPYRASVISYIREHSSQADDIVLATAANFRIAERVAQESGLFTAVLASDGKSNLSGERKLQAIQEFSNGRPFDYIGDHRRDLPIWDASREAIVVEDSNRLQNRIHGALRVTTLTPGTRATFRDWLKQLRVHQWSKNLLLLLPLILAHKLASIPAIAACVAAIIAFCGCASAVYIINDLIDLPHDRSHTTKSRRPLARGAIPIRQAAAAAVGLLCASILLGTALLPASFVWMLLGYVLASLAYSLWFKRVVIVDVLLLSGFYVYRVLIGAVAVQVTVSFWLLAFSLFFFLALGIIKRYADLVLAGSSNTDNLAGRCYSSADTDFFRSMGLSCSCVSVLVLALYIQSQEVTQLYTRPEFLWLVCPLALYWLMRVWLIASRGKMPDDPIVFALRDRASYLIGGLTALLVLLAAV